MTVQTAAGGSQEGDITLSTPFDVEDTTGANTLTLEAHHNVWIEAPITDAAGGASLNLVLDAGNRGDGGVVVGSDLTLFGGSLRTDGDFVVIEDGAVVTVDSVRWAMNANTLLIADSVGRVGDGTVIVRNRGTIDATGKGVLVGDDPTGGVGTLTIESGAEVRARWVVVGGSAGSGSQGAVTVTDAGSTLAATVVLDVGRQGAGRLVVGSGARVTAGRIFVGRKPRVAGRAAGGSAGVRSAPSTCWGSARTSISTVWRHWSRAARATRRGRRAAGSGSARSPSGPAGPWTSTWRGTRRSGRASARTPARSRRANAGGAAAGARRGRGGGREPRRGGWGARRTRTRRERRGRAGRDPDVPGVTAPPGSSRAREAGVKGPRVASRTPAARRWVAGLLAGAAMAAATVPALAREAAPVVRFEVERFVVEGGNPLSEAETRAVLDPFTGEHAGVEGLLAAADALERAIRDAGVAFQRVALPPQSLQDGEVVLRVAVFRVTGVEVRGAEHHSEANVRRSAPALREGETPDTGAIARDLAVANRQPWKTTTLTFRESATDPEGLDAVLEVEDRAPRLLWSGLSNTGNAATGPWRWSLGGSFGNLFDRDHTLDASFTTSPGHAGQVRQWGVGYGLPVLRPRRRALGVLRALGRRYRPRARCVRRERDGPVRRGALHPGARAPGAAVPPARRGHRRPAFRQQRGVRGRRRPRAGRAQPAGVPALCREYAGGDWGLDFHLQYARNLGSGGDNDDAAYGAAIATGRKRDGTPSAAAPRSRPRCRPGGTYEASSRGSTPTRR